MQLVTADEIDFEHRGGHRAGGIAFKRYFTGRPGSVGCYEFSLTRLSAYSTPRHTHNHDQVRFALAGDFNYGRGRDIPEGWICYHPEGAPYGPQRVEQECLVLTLQMGGMGGHGFMTYDQVHAANAALRATGEFRDGVYFPASTPTRGVDGWEAVWAHVHGGAAPGIGAPRYPEPVLIDPGAFSWRPVTGQDGVQVKHLGTFTEGRLTIEQSRIAAGARRPLRAAAAPVIQYVLDGELRVAGRACPAGSALLLEPGEEAELEGTATSTVYGLGLATFPFPDAY